MKIIVLSCLFAVVLPYVKATGYYFFVQLKDKQNTPFSLSNPNEFLSQRSIDRRTFYGIPIDSTDLPVNQTYIDQIKALNVYIHCTTKWLNGVTVLMKDTSVVSQIRLLPFVKMAQFTGITNENPLTLAPQKVPFANQSNYDYGVAATQIKQLNGNSLHENGYNGENIYIAVLDAGFTNVDTNPAFERMRSEGRLLGTKDFVNPQSNIFTQNTHGAMVLSTMAAEIDGTFVGTAPKASYLLLRTEADAGEYLCEPDFWVSGIEYADSIGVDLATTSLGYTTFDDSRMNYTYQDLNGQTARASIAATMAYQKGILLLNAAGNEGNKTWKYISVPADAEGVITVGSVSSDSLHSAFSSIGPTPDSRVKPELCAMGTSSAVITTSGTTAYSNGTSFATPILAGLTACYLQAAKSISPSIPLNELRENLYKSANLYASPTPQLGYGLPDFQKALSALQNTRTLDSSWGHIRVSVQKNTNVLTISLPTDYEIQKGRLHLYSVTGEKVKSQDFTQHTFNVSTENLKQGIYFLQIENSGSNGKSIRSIRAISIILQ